jgi:hypothetical protein
LELQPAVSFGLLIAFKQSRLKILQ